jgi:hypothetical protein
MPFIVINEDRRSFTHPPTARYLTDVPHVRDRTINEGQAIDAPDGTAMSMEALYILDTALNATCLEREGFLASLALRAGTIQQTSNRSKVCFL